MMLSFPYPSPTQARRITMIDNLNRYWRSIGYSLMLMLACNAGLLASEPKTPTRPPNFVIIFTDDLGYGDLGCFGSTTIKTPNIDQMASEGMRLTSFYAQTVCGPSRAALMTGCYPLRVAINQNKVEVHPELHLNEITIAELLKTAGYTSAAFGKWDLAGHSQTKFVPSLLPLHQGFDEFFGTPTSNDSIVGLIRDNDVIEKRVDMRELTRRYTDEAIDFIKRSQSQSFFVYLAHTMPHVELAASEAFQGKSATGIYGDVVEEIDANVGRILETLKNNGLDENTYVVFTSDNGPWYFGRSAGHQKRFGKDAVSHGGSASPLRGAKTSTWEGGLRVPCIVRSPGKIPANTHCDELASTMDLLPTIAKLAGVPRPTDRVIDGHDIGDLIHGVADAKTPTDAFYFYRRTRLEAVRSGKWKLHVPRPVDKQWAKFSKAEDAVAVTSPLLFDLDADIGESNDVADQHPEVVTALTKLIQRARVDIGDYDRIGENARFFDPQPHRPNVAKSKRSRGKFPGPKSDFHGFERYSVATEKGKISVVCPKQAAAGKPWLWRSIFWGGTSAAVGRVTEGDMQLLKKGYHVVVAPGDVSGHPSGNAKIDAAYELLTKKYGFSPTVSMASMSRETLALFRWASCNPKKVESIYVDNGVCNVNSWPGGKLVPGNKSNADGSAKSWALFKKTYGYESDAEALANKESPIDLLEPLAKANVPILMGCGTNDSTVPYEENGAIMKQRYLELGGSIRIITEDKGHHPHGLADMKPVIDFVVEHTQLPVTSAPAKPAER